ncbi:VOC family protein, partial [Candidatus Kaiserbacteria bacterium]|nr:VOC family protein [Candidatus Kaiserbacteria bacterium]
MRYLHSMVRVKNLEEAISFYCGKLGLEEVYRYDNQKGRFTNVFLKAPSDEVGAAPKERKMGMSTYVAPVLELTYNWAPEECTSGRNFGHLAYG